MTKRGAETSGEKDAERLATIDLLGDALKKLKKSDNPKTWTAYANLALERFPAVEERIRALESELAETKWDAEESWNCEHGARNAKDDALKERDAALARVKELEYWRNGSWAMKALDKARDERDAALASAASNQKAYMEYRAEVEALKAQDEVHWKTRRSLIKERDAARAEAEALRAGIALAIREIKGRYDTEDDAPMWISAVVNDLARLSPPAPAPKPHPWSAAGLALRD